MKVNIVASTGGKGPNTEEERSVLITKLDFGFKSTDMFPDDPFNGELRAYFEGSGFGYGAWNVEGYGLIHGDRDWMREFKAGMNELGFSQKCLRDCQYNDKELQGKNYVSFQVGPVFYKSWEKLVKKGILKE